MCLVRTHLEHALNLGRLLDPDSRNVDDGDLVDFGGRVVEVEVGATQNKPVPAPLVARRVAKEGERAALVGRLSASKVSSAGYEPR